MNFLSALFLAGSLMTSCTYSISMVHTEGTASDVIDDTATNAPNISPTITGLPALP